MYDIPFRSLINLLILLILLCQFRQLLALVLQPPLLLLRVQFDIRECFSHILDIVVAAGDDAGHFVPLDEELVPLLVLPFELLGGFVDLDLGGLGLGDLFLEVFLEFAVVEGVFLDLEVELAVFGLILPHVLFEGDVVLLFLFGGQRPLVQLLLVPVHLKLKLLQFFSMFKNLGLDLIEPLLELGRLLIQLPVLTLGAPDLALDDLREMVFALSLLVFLVDQPPVVQQFVLHVVEVLGEDFDSVLELVDLSTDELDGFLLDLDLLVELLVGLVREFRELVDLLVLLQVHVIHFITDLPILIP